MQTPNVILSLIRLELQGRPPEAGITEVTVEAIPAVPRILQSSLFEPSAPHPEKLSRTLARLSAIVGSKNLGTPKLLDTYRPDAVVLESFRLSHPTTKPSEKSGKKLPELRRDSGKKFSSATIEYPVTQLSLRRLRPPQPFRIHMDRIVSCAGPWKSSGDWWMEPNGEDRWSREEWDIEMTDGSVCRIFWDNRTREWFLEGVYD
jgi:protein ImuB